MYLSTALLAALFSVALAIAREADPVVTSAPVSPYHENLIRADVLRRRVQDVPKGTLNRRLDDLHFCYGEGSICGAAIDLYNGCEAFDGKSYYQCICENGWVSTDQACHWCDTYYDISDIDVYDINTRECSSFSVSVAPVPSSILAAQSQYNATQTNPPNGTPNTSGSAKPTTAASNTEVVTGGGSGASSTLGNSGAAKSTTTGLGASAVPSKASTSTFTLNGGGGSQLPAPTLPPLISNTINLPSSTGNSASGGGSGGAASGLNERTAMLCSAAAFGGALWFMMLAGLW